MRQIVLDGAQIATRGALHDVLAQQLQLPEWYGRNLDALFDCLTDVCEPTQLTLVHAQAMEQQLGGYAQAFAQVLRLAAQENSALLFDKLDFL